MKARVEALLAAYEAGRMSRSGLVDELAALAGEAPSARAAAPAHAQAEAQAPAPRPSRPQAMVGVSINHVTMSVSDFRRTTAFFRSLLDVPVIGESDFEIDLGIGQSFVAVMETSRPIGIDHFCIGVPGYDAARVADFVASRGLEPHVFTEHQGVRFREPQVYVADPDGILVQFSRPDYAGEMHSGR
jgi:catechol 2,3-dioxygenase-like lactoylglutathione lyase family enzyme